MRVVRGVGGGRERLVCGRAGSTESVDAMSRNEELIAEAREYAHAGKLPAPAHAYILNLADALEKAEREKSGIEATARDWMRAIDRLTAERDEAQRKIAAALEYLTAIREDHAPHILIVRDGAIAALSTPAQPQKEAEGE